jgi:hypothetical protein
MWEAIVLIVLIVSVVKMMRARHQAGGSYQAQPPATSSVEQDALRREVVELRERIKVLERIATDGRATRELADEIEKLR